MHRATCPHIHRIYVLYTEHEFLIHRACVLYTEHEFLRHRTCVLYTEHEFLIHRICVLYTEHEFLIHRTCLLYTEHEFLINHTRESMIWMFYSQTQVYCAQNTLCVPVTHVLYMHLVHVSIQRTCVLCTEHKFLVHRTCILCTEHELHITHPKTDSLMCI